MARLVITGQDGTTFEIRPNEMETISMEATPEMDSSGMEVLFHRVKLEVRAIINPLMMATNQPTVSLAVVPPPGALPPAGLTFATGPGDRSGLTARVITQLLGNPRPLVQYWIGPDLVLEAPNRIDAAGTQFLPCDAMGGPFVRRCRCYEVRGDKTIFLNFSVELATTAYTKILLSNRWSMTADIDSAGFTTRTIDGTAVFRLDGLVAEEAFPDDFRNLLLVPSDSSFRRIRPSWTVEDDNRTYRYRCIDRETSYGLGANSGVEKIEGTISVHSGVEVFTFKKLAHRGIDTAAAIAAEAASFWTGAGAAFTARTVANIAHQALNMSSADTRVSCVVRVLGQSGANNQNLYKIARQVFSIKVQTPALASGNLLAIESITLTQWIGSEDQPTVEVRFTLVMQNLISAKGFLGDTFAPSLMDMNTGVGAPLNYLPSTPRTQLPNSNNTRGSGYLNNIFAQALTPVPGSLPPAPIAPPIAMDITTEV